jgi:hypothetical protein
MTIFGFDYNDKSILFETDPQSDTQGISIDWKNNWITYKMMIKDNIRYHIYNLTPSDVNITLRVDDNNPMVGIDMGVATFGVEEIMVPQIAESLQRILKARIAKQARQAGRELAGVKQLPTLENTASLIGSFVSGTPGSLTMQRNRLRRNTGIEGPLRMTRSEVRDQAREAREGGRRQTRRK